MITWIKEANKAKVQPKGVRFCLFSQLGVAYKQACSSIEVLMSFITSVSNTYGRMDFQSESCLVLAYSSHFSLRLPNDLCYLVD